MQCNAGPWLSSMSRSTRMMSGIMLGVSHSLLLFCVVMASCQGVESSGANHYQLKVDASPEVARKIPGTLFGLFFEEINHAGAGGICAELVNNRGFEAGGPDTPSNIDPWSIVGDDSFVFLATDRTSCFSRNIVALMMEVLCNDCPTGGVGIYNPGFWGMNLASATITVSGASNWTKLEQKLVAKGTNRTSRLQITTNKKGVVWFDQVSLMPADTYKGHGFRTELISMLLDLKPRFLRFPGGCFVEGVWLKNAFRWRESISPWEERDTLEMFSSTGLMMASDITSFSRLAEDLDVAPIWVLNAVSTTSIEPFVKDALDGLEFARGNAESTWGSVRAAMGHPERFPLKYIAIGNEDCEHKSYQGNYLKFYNPLREAYPDIQMISNCDGSSRPLDHPADLYDFHVFVSGYAAEEPKTGKGSLLVALAEAAFLTGLEKNSDIIHMASYAPLFVNDNYRRWNPDAIVFNSWQQYGTPSYWVQMFSRESSGAVIHPVAITSEYLDSFSASAITWKDHGNSFLRVKIVNFGSDAVNFTIRATGLQARVNKMKSRVTVLTSSNLLDENSFSNPNKVVPVTRQMPNAAKEVQAQLSPYSFTSFDLDLE
ncbi:hypothetical protein ACP4OV_021507 [Aristida adscensionis]